MKNKLKHLAEQHHCLDKKLTLGEEKLLLNSKYKNLVRRNTTFNSLFERCVNEQTESFTAPKRKRIFSGGNKKAIQALVDDVEETFGIGIENMSLTKFEDINFKEVQTHIMDYLNEHEEELRGGTFDEIQSVVLKSKNIYDLLRSIYFYGS